MLGTSLALSLLVVSALVLVPPPARAASCNVAGGDPVPVGPFVVTVPVPSGVGPVTVPEQTVGGQTVGGGTVGGQSVGGQTVGPVTLPVLGTVSGVPVVGTVVLGGQTVGPTTVPVVTVPVVPVPSHTLPQETVGGETVGPAPTGLDPIVVTIFRQTVPQPVDVGCAIQITNNATWCVDEFAQGGTVARLSSCLRNA